jgi:hypothetical protein
MAELTFSPCPPQHNPLLDVVARRCINRKTYKKIKISADVKKTLLQFISPGVPVKMEFLEEGPVFDRLINALAVSDSFSVFNKEVHAFFYRSLRWSEREIKATKDGMPIKTLELDFFDRINLWFMRSWTWAYLNSLLGVRMIFVARRKSVYKKTAAFGVLTIERWNPDVLIAVGEAVQKMWLKATELNLAFHGMMGLPLLAYASAHTHGILSNGDKNLILNAMPAMNSGEMAFLFRIGEADRPSARALRRPVEAVLEVA